MAKTVYDSKVISLQDETDVTLAPLPIGRLKKFMNAWRAFENVKTEDEAYDIYINCAGIALERNLTNKVPVEKFLDTENVLTDEYREYLEDVLDMDTIFEILDVCGGLKLNDPKLLEAAAKAAAEQAGKN